jgi:hypothetical protein
VHDARCYDVGMNNHLRPMSELRANLEAFVRELRARVIRGELKGRAQPTGRGNEYNLFVAEERALIYVWPIDFEAELGMLELHIDHKAENDHVVDLTHFTSGDMVRMMLDGPWSKLPTLE